MKKYWYKVALMAVALGLFAACSDDDDDEVYVIRCFMSH